MDLLSIDTNRAIGIVCLPPSQSTQRLGTSQILSAHLELKGDSSDYIGAESICGLLLVGKNEEDHGALKGHLKKLARQFAQSHVLYKPYNTQQVVLIEMAEDIHLGGSNRRESTHVGNFDLEMLGKYLQILTNTLANDDVSSRDVAITFDPPESSFFSEWAKAVTQQFKK